MKLTDHDKKIGFVTVSDGWHAFEIQQPAFTEKDGTLTNVMRIPLRVIEDEEEGGQVSIFCDLDSKTGRTKLATILGYSGVAAILEKNKKLPGGDLTPAEWGEKFLNPEKEACKSVIMTAMTQMVSNKLKAEVKTRAVKRKNDETGEEATRDFQNVVTIDYYYPRQQTSNAKAAVETTDEDWG